MSDRETAWIVQEYLGGRTQAAIADEGEVSAAEINRRITEFCCKWSGYDVKTLMVYGEDRRVYLARALQAYSAGRTVTPLKPDFARRWPVYGIARAEYAWLLRAEGLTYREIGDRFDVSQTRAQQIVKKFARKMRWAMRRTRFRVEGIAQ